MFDVNNYDYDKSMLGKEYFDGTHDRECDEVMKMLDNVFEIYDEVEIEEERIIGDLLVEKKIYKNLEINFPDDKDLILFFCKRTKMIEEKDMYVILYPINKKDDDSDYVTRYEIEKWRYDLFVICNMYNMSYDNDRYKDSLALRLRTNVHLLPMAARQSQENMGQLKILIDIVKAVDDISFDDGDRILVVGSAAEGGHFSGIMYEVIAYMEKKKQIFIDLYDPEDVDVMYTIGTVTYKHHKKKFFYSEEVLKYRLVLDDVWVADVDTRVWDPLSLIFQVRNFSCKWFEWYGQPRSSVDYQIASTDTSEVRVTSRRNHFFFQNHTMLGNCVACRELKYCLKKQYSVEFYDFFLAAHATNCITKVKRQGYYSDVQVERAVWYDIKPLSLHKSHCCVKWDRIVGYDCVYPDKYKQTAFRLVFSSQDYVREDLYRQSECVVLGEGTYKINKLNLGCYEYVLTDNVTMSASDYKDLRKPGEDFVKKKEKRYLPIHKKRF